MEGLDKWQATVFEIARARLGPNMNVRAIAPYADVDKDAFIILWDRTEESLFALPEVLRDMAYDTELPDFTIDDACELIEWAVRHQ